MLLQVLTLKMYLEVKEKRTENIFLSVTSILLKTSLLHVSRLFKHPERINTCICM